MSRILITGASAGIGAAAAIELTRAGHEVLATGRSPRKLAAVHARMRAVAPAGRTVPEPIPADLSELRNVAQLARTVADRLPELEVLVNNAGLQPGRRSVTSDGIELTLAVNHLAPFLLTSLLAGQLRDQHGRVVTTASSNHATGQLDLSDLELSRGWTARAAYDRSKLANVLFTAEVWPRLKIAASSFHPGTVSTDLNRDARLARWLKPTEKLIMASPPRGADTLVWLATGTEGGAPAAVYYQRRRPRPVGGAAADADLAARLWEVSTELVSPYLQ